MSEATVVSPEFDSRSVVIERAVPDDAQGMVIGGKLMNQVLDLFGCDQDIFLEVVSYNQKAIDFYKRFGFEQTDAINEIF